MRSDVEVYSGLTIPRADELYPRLSGTGTDHHIARFDGTTAIQDSKVQITDTGHMILKGDPSCRISLGDSVGEDGLLYANSIDAYPYMKLWGTAGVDIYVETTNSFSFYDETTLFMSFNKTINIKEQASSNSDTAAFGQFWVKSDAPCTPYYTGDTGVDHWLGDQKEEHIPLVELAVGLAF